MEHKLQINIIIIIITAVIIIHSATNIPMQIWHEYNEAKIGILRRLKIGKGRKWFLASFKE